MVQIDPSSLPRFGHSLRVFHGVWITPMKYTPASVRAGNSTATSPGRGSISGSEEPFVIASAYHKAPTRARNSGRDSRAAPDLGIDFAERNNRLLSCRIGRHQIVAQDRVLAVVAGRRAGGDGIAADLLRSRADTIAPYLTREQGKPLAAAKGEVMAGADVIDWFTEEARRSYGRVIPARADGIYQLVVKEPVGPVAAFTPWNFPINQVVRKLSIALAAGCSIIVKAAEET